MSVYLVTYADREGGDHRVRQVGTREAAAATIKELIDSQEAKPDEIWLYYATYQPLEIKLAASVEVGK